MDLKAYQIGVTYEELGLGVTLKGRVYNTQRLSKEEQQEWSLKLIDLILADNCKIEYSVYQNNLALLLYKYIPYTSGWRLINRYDEGDILATIFKAYLDRHLFPEGPARQENFREALARCA